MFSFILAGCLPANTPLPPLPTNTPLAPTATPTQTPVWFPPTATNTPYPTSTIEMIPTQDYRPDYGEVIFQDSFTDPSLWELNQGTNASAAISDGQLTLALRKMDAFLYSLRVEPELRDFYLEITASPSLCKNNDEYGLLLHFDDPGNFFRYAITCDGHARLDRVLKSYASSPQPLTLSGSIPPGAPSTSRLAVSMEGREMRFFINDELLFRASDPSLPVGLVGVFIRSGGETAVTVNFSDLVVYRLTGE